MASKDIGGFMVSYSKINQSRDKNRSIFFLYVAAVFFGIFTSTLFALAYIFSWGVEYVFSGFILAVIFTLLFSFIAVCIILSFKLILHIVRSAFLNVTENP